MSESQPRVLFLSLSDDVGSERIVSEMGRRGALCAVLGRTGALAALSVHVAHREPLPSRGGLWIAAAAARRRLERVRRTWRPDAIVPLDDMAAQLLRDVARAPGTDPDLRRLLVASLGDPRHYGTLCSRAALVEAAAAIGVRTPAQRSVRDVAAARAAGAELGYPLMLKREQTCGGSGVALIRSERALIEAFRGADLKARAKRGLRRLFGFRSAPGEAALSLQAFAAGGLAMRTVACTGGQVLAGASFAAERLDPPVTGSSTVIRPIENAEMDEAARRIVASFGCSGFVSFDFMLSADGRATLIEMNARPIGSGHLGARFGQDVYGAWLRRFVGFVDRSAAPAAAEQPRPVALFPKEMQRDPESACLRPGADCLHDVPWDEPLVLAAYGERLKRRHPGHAHAIALLLAPDEARRDLRADARPARWAVKDRRWFGVGPHRA